MDSAAGEFRRRQGVEKANRAILQFRRSELDVRINMCYTLLMASRVLLSE